MNLVREPRGLRVTVLYGSAFALSLACSFGEIQSSGDGDAPILTDEEGDELGSQLGEPVDDGQSEVSGSGTADDTETTDDVDDASTPSSPPGGLMDDPQFQTDIAVQALGVLETNCSQCHSNGVALGDVGSILDFRTLIDQGKLVMGSKEDSSIFTRMDVGTMPPASSQQRPSPGDIAIVGDFIDGLVDPDASACEPLDFMTQDELFSLLQRDILAQDIQDRPFIRYLGANYASNAGKCGSDLQRQRYALFKMINSISLNPRITQPQPIEADELIYRIDIRDYDWDREIDLEDDGVVDFADGWLATLDAMGAYAVEYEGDEADIVKEQTGTDVPFVSINAWVQEVTTGDLYYALIGGRANILDTEVDLGIDLQESIDEGTLLRAGFKTSGVSKQDRNLTRQDIGNYAGSYWLSQDFADLVGNDSSFADPLDFEFNGGEAIYNLPNGMQAYYATNDEGDRAVEVPANIVIDPAQNNGIVTNAASCHSCHNAGMIPFVDTVRSYVENNPQAFDAETYEGVMEQFPGQSLFNTLVERDSERHVAAVERAGVPRGTSDPISRVYLKFQLGDISPAEAAGELGVTVDQLQRNITRLDPRLADLGQEEGRVDRNTFTSTFLDSLCIMQSASQNRPANCQ